MVDEHKLLGTQLGYYTLTRLLGQGGMGVVFVGLHRELEVEYAVKVLHRLADETFIARFKREAQRAASLDHPNIVKVFHFGHDPDADVVYLVMTLVDGESLAKTLKDGRLEPGPAIDVALQVADALDYAHECGIIHRDIKPDNILLEPGGVVKIVDFGLARMREEDRAITTADRALGTPEYMAIEQWEGKEVDHRTDLHALGIVLYEMLSGEKPFRGTPSSIFTARLSGTFTPLNELRDDLPDGLVEVVHKLMAGHPDDRYPDGREVVNALTPLLPDGYERARPAVTRRFARATDSQDGAASASSSGLHDPDASASASVDVSGLGEGDPVDGVKPAANTPPDGVEAGPAAMPTQVQSAASKEVDHRTIVLPAIQNFTCQHSGHCCRFKEIPVNRDEATRLQSREWGPRLPHLVNAEPFADGFRHPGRKTFNLEPADGSCPFHDGLQMLCAIHEQLGAHAKPLACQQFPYRFTVTPAGTFVGLSFSCPTVRRNGGKTVAGQGTEIARFVQRSGVNQTVLPENEEARLAPGRTTSWSALIKVETVIDDVLAKTDLPVWRGLIAGERLVAQLQVAAAGLTGGKAPTPPEQIVERVRTEEFVPLPLGFGEKLFWARLANRLKSRPDAYYAQHSAFARMMHRFFGMRRWLRLITGGPWGMAWRSHERQATATTTVTGTPTPPTGSSASSSASASGRHPSWKPEVRPTDALAVSPALPSDADDMLRRFLRMKLHANDFFGPSVNRLSFISGYRMLMVSIGMVMFIARSRAAARGAKTIGFDDVDLGMATVADQFYTDAFYPRRMSPAIESALTRRAGLGRKLLLRWAVSRDEAPTATTTN